MAPPATPVVLDDLRTTLDIEGARVAMSSVP